MFSKAAAFRMCPAVIAALFAGTAAQGNPPKGAVIAFNLAACPKGWGEFAPAYGRFIRGIDRGAAKLDPQGERQPGTVQEDEIRAHNHERPRDVYDAGRVTTGSVNQGGTHAYTYSAANGPIFTSSVGGPESRPKNVALLYCERR